jgi:two-component system cell cycle response regulator
MTRILVIEDNAHNLELMSYLLTAQGFEIETAVDGERAMQSLVDSAFDLIICDVHLPKIDGLELVSIIKSRSTTAHVPVIAVTALAMVGDRERLLAAGFDAYIAKPIDPAGFLKEIQAILQAKSYG